MLEIENKIKLEEKIHQINLPTLTNNKYTRPVKLTKYFLNLGYPIEEAEYLTNACLMPINEITNYLIMLETENERVLVRTLMQKFECKELEVLTRIKDVIKINDYQENLKRQR